MLARDPESRPTCDQILQHPWFSTVHQMTFDNMVGKFGLFDPNPEEQLKSKTRVRDFARSDFKYQDYWKKADEKERLDRDFYDIIKL